MYVFCFVFFFSSRRRHTRLQGDWSSDVCSSDLFQRPVANYRYISPDYFKAMTLPVRSGRAFAFSDRNKAVVMVSQSTAARIWPGEDAIGKHVRQSDDSEAFAEVVGVATDTRTSMKGDPPLMVYMPYWKNPQFGAS